MASAEGDGNKAQEKVEEQEVGSGEGATAPQVAEDDDDDKFVPGKPVSLQEQLEMDKEDESLRRWKEQLLGTLPPAEGGKAEPEVTFLSMQLLVEGRDPLDLTIPPLSHSGADAESPSPSSASVPALHFVLKEKSVYRIKFEFLVKNELVLGLTYWNRAYRMGLQVDKTKIMMGTYGPQKEPYTFLTEEETTPHGMLARGKYSAKTAFMDDDGRTYLGFEYTFEIKSDW